MGHITEEQKEAQRQKDLLQFKQNPELVSTGVKYVEQPVPEAYYNDRGERVVETVKKGKGITSSRHAGILSKADPMSLYDVVNELGIGHLKKEESDYQTWDKMMDEFMGFDVLESTEISEEELTRQALLARQTKAEEFDIPQTLYKSSEEAKKRVLKSLQIDEVTKSRLLNEQKSLEEILQTYVEKDQQAKAAKEGKRFLKTFRKAKEELNNNPLLTGRERVERLVRLAKPYEACVAMYKEEYFVTLDNTSRERGIEELLDRITKFYDLFVGGDFQEIDLERENLIHDMRIGYDTNDSILERVQKNAYRLDRKEPKDSDPELDRSLSDAQIAGIQEIDRFLIDQAGTSGGNLAFIDRLMRLTLRDRLMIYGLVEKKRDQAPDPTDIAYTQICYTPNATAFKNAMTFLPKFMWTGNKRSSVARTITNIKWEKLEAALDVLKQDNAIQVRDSMASLVGRKDDGYIDGTKELNASVNVSDEEFERLPESEKEAINLIRDLDRKEDARNRQFDVAIKALNEARDALETAEGSILKKKAKKAFAEEKSKEAKEAMKKLEELDLELFLTADAVRAQARDFEGIRDHETDFTLGESIDKKIRGKAPKEGMGKKAVSASIFLTSQGSLLLSKMNKIATIATGTSSNGINYAAGAFTSITGLVGLIGGLMAMKNVCTTIKDNHSQLAAEDIANMVLKTTRNIGGAAWGTVAGLTQMGLVAAGQVAARKAAKGMLEVAGTMKDNIEFAGNVVSYATAAVSGVKLLVDAGDAAVQLKHAVHLGVAAYRVNYLEKKGELRGVDALYADNILKVDARNKKREFLNTANSMMVNAGAIVSTLFGGPVGAVAFAGASVVNSFVMKVFNKVSKKLDRASLVDDFLQVENITKKVVPGYDKMSIFGKRRARHRMKEQLAAEMGYVSEKALSAHIIGNYAQFIYSKLFFVDDDPARPLVKKNDKDHTLTNISMACYQMVKSLGLSVKFPETPDGDRVPTPVMIAAKLNG